MNERTKEPNTFKKTTKSKANIKKDFNPIINSFPGIQFTVPFIPINQQFMSFSFIFLLFFFGQP